MVSLHHLVFIALIALLVPVLVRLVNAYFRGRMQTGGGGLPIINLQETNWVEKRQDPRAELQWPVKIESPQGPVRAETKDISISGAFVMCEHPLDPGQVVPMSIDAPNRDPVNVTAEVVWSNKNVPDDQVVVRGMGVRFIGIPLEDRQYLNRAVKEHLEQNEK